ELAVAGDLAQRPHLDAGQLHVDQQHGQPGLLRTLVRGPGEQEAVVRQVRDRRPDLLPVDYVDVAVARGAGAQRRQVGAGVGLGVAGAPGVLAVQDRRDVALLLRRAAIADDRRADPEQPHAARDRRRVGARQLLVEDRLLLARQAAAAVLL